MKKIESSKTRAQLLEDFNGLKNNPYWIMLRFPLILLALIFFPDYLSDIRVQKSSVQWFFILTIYFAFEMGFIVERMRKQITILFELTNILHDSEAGDK